ncbi:MAG: hypothetical protein R2874_16470 [Desulfobacterales bacterium]
MSIESQCIEVKHVKKSESGMIVDPVTTNPDMPIREVLTHAAVPDFRCRDCEKRLVGIVTNRDLRF